MEVECVLLLMDEGLGNKTGGWADADGIKKDVAEATCGGVVVVVDEDKDVDADDETAVGAAAATVT